MHECGPNQFKCSSRTDSCCYKSIVCMIKGPIPISNFDVFQLSDDDFDSFKNLCHLKILKFYKTENVVIVSICF